MNATEVILLIFGFLSISVSFFVGNKEKSAVDEDTEGEAEARDIWTQKEEEMVREQIRSILEEEKENTLVQTTDTLNRKSNEKIMEFDEFSSQLMEKIHHNHEEVVFMYNMLTTKENEWKEAAAKQKADEKKKMAQTIVQQQMSQPTPDPGPAKPVQVPQPSRPEPVPKAVRSAESEQPVPKKEAVQQHKAEEKRPETGLERLARQNSAKAAKTVKKTAEPKAEKVSVPKSSGEDSTSANNQIIKMYKQGKSVVEISKELNVGQGEVKLTLALYGGDK